MRIPHVVAPSLLVSALATAGAAQARPSRATCCRRRRSSTSSISRRRPTWCSARRATSSPCSSTRAMPTIAELSRPMLRLAGLRIDPATNGRHRARTARALTLKAVADGAVRPVTLPASPALTWLGFSPDGARFAFAHTKPTGIELWIGETATGTRQGDARRRSQRRAGDAVRVGRHGRARCVCATTVPGRGAARRRRPCRPARTCRNIAAGSRRCAPTRTC